MAANYGIMGQLQGPFTEGTNIIPYIINKVNSMGGNINNPIFAKIGITLAEKDFMLFGENKSSFKMLITIDGDTQEIWMGKTQIYESDNGLNLSSLIFPQGAPASVFIDYVILDN